MSVIKIDPEIMHGTPCFAGTRVPITHLFEFLSTNEHIDEFVDQFPSIRRHQAIGLIGEALEALLAAHSSSGQGVTGVVQTDREILGGTPCFAGTRVPVKYLFEHLARGRTLTYFLESYPSVEEEQAQAALEQAKDALLPMLRVTAR